MPDRRLIPVLAALMTGLLLAELDQSMIAAALPSIVAELGALDGLLWLTAGYLVAATAVLPLCGALGDRWGRRAVIMVSLLVIMAGSVVGGLASSLSWLIVARVIQGLGAGGMLVLVQAAVADVLPVRDRAATMSMVGAMFAIAAVTGPLLGGWLAEGPGWRWVFWINVPLAAVAVIASWRLLPGRPDGARPPRLQAAHLLPIDLFGTRAYALVAGCGLVLGAALFGVIGYLPSYLQLALGQSPLDAGWWMLAAVAGIGIGTVASAQVVARTGVHRPLPILGGGLAAVGLALLAVTADRESLAVTVVGFVGVGLGIGLAWEVLVIMAQNAVPAERVGAATALNGFTREIGVLLGTAYAGGMITTGLTAGRPPTEVFAAVFGVLAAVALAAALLLLAVPARPLSTDPPLRRAPARQADPVVHR